MSKIKRWQSSHPGVTREFREVVEARYFDEALGILSDWVEDYEASYDPDEDVAPDFYWMAKDLIERAKNENSVKKEN